MTNPLSLEQLTAIVERHPEPFAIVRAQPTVTIDSVAFAVSKLAVDDDAARDVVATSSGRPLEEIPGGLMTMIQAAAIAAQAFAAHPHESIARIFIRAVVPGFGDETGTVQ
ncbi:hypothetical protein [Sphingomonas sp. R86521]|uniref:hypothetical protein n=1 Tax=Sphingomonas sp. R86521 TaxID=3093860 RepID=UPI0036D2B57D